MIRKDYIMRLIEEVAKILAKVIFKKEEDCPEEALKEIDNAFGKIIGIDPKLLDIISVDDIAELMGISKDSSIGSMKCILTGKLLKEKADMLSINDIKHNEYYRKAIGLYLKGINNALKSGTETSEYTTDVKTMEKQLRNSLSEEELYQLFTFYDSTGNYERAEDLLFYLKNLKYPDISTIARQFFEKLQNIDEASLNRCGLSRNEVAESFEDFNKI